MENSESPLRTEAPVAGVLLMADTVRKDVHLDQVTYRPELRLAQTLAMGTASVRQFQACLEAWKPKKWSFQRRVCLLGHFSHVWLCVTWWTVALQAPPSLGFSREEYWRGLPCPPPRDLPDSGIEPVSLTSLALTGSFFTTSVTKTTRS